MFVAEAISLFQIEKGAGLPPNAGSKKSVVSFWKVKPTLQLSSQAFRRSVEKSGFFCYLFP